MTRPTGINVIFGGAGLKTEADILWYQDALDVLEKHGVKNLDSAKKYQNSEVTIGKYNAGARFAINTKCGTNDPGSITKAGVIAMAEDSLRKLGVEQLDVFYIHAPDPTVPLEDTLAGIDAVYRKGSFKRFGISNYSSKEVRKIYNICKTNGYVLPTVYQGDYSAIQRKKEKDLFPLLRKLGISFEAYGPLSNGFLAKTRQQFVDGHGRFSSSNPRLPLFHHMYNKPAMLDALDTWGEIARDAGCSKAGLASRWVRYNSALDPEFGDALIIGASNLKQLEETLDEMEAGPLPDEIANRVDKIWDTVKDVSEGGVFDAGEKLKEKAKTKKMKADQLQVSRQESVAA